jgi:murein DD-endopeptidase MepM/ murein hydrolase activator NlpD
MLRSGTRPGVAAPLAVGARRRTTALAVLPVALLAVVGCTAPAPPSPAAPPPGPAQRPPSARLAVPTAPALTLCHLPPVDAPVSDGFRPPTHRWGPGNRGLTYATTPGSPVRASAPGVVRFAGRIGPHAYVAVVHADGLRTTYSYLATIRVRAGKVLTGRTTVGTTGRTFHFGVLLGGTYLDPATVLGRGCHRRRAVLVPLGG